MKTSTNNNEKLFYKTNSIGPLSGGGGDQFGSGKIQIGSDIEKKFRSDSVISDNSKFKMPSDDVDSDIISNYIGHYGLWQFLWTFVLCLFQLPCTFHIFALVFQASLRDHWCSRPSHLKDVAVNLWRNMTQPRGACEILNLDYDQVTAENFVADMSIAIGAQNEYNLMACEHFEFDGSLIGDTIISEWNLVCDMSHFTSVVEMCFLAGAAVGSISSGWVSDRCGRKNTLMSFATLQFVCGLSLAFVTSLPLYMTLRFVIGIASMSVVVVSFVLVVELVSGTYRTVIGILNILPVAIAYVITAGISYLAYDWRTMQLYITVPCIALLTIWYHVPESPRWLLENGKIDQLVKIIETAAWMNRIKLPSNYESTLKRETNNSEAGEDDSMVELNRKISILDLFRGGYLRTTLLMIIVWFALILLYFGITLHLSNLGGNIYTNTIIAGSVEALSICLSIFVVLKLGLRINLFVYMLIAGVACIMVNFAPEGNLWFIITAAMIGKCAIGANNAIIPTFTAFQYPTVMRNLGVGIGNFAAGLALIIVPYLWLLEHIQIHLPMTIMGVVGIIGAAALFMMKDNSIKKTESTQRVVDGIQNSRSVTPPAIVKSNEFDNVSYIHTERF